MAETMLRFNIEVDAATGKARLREFGDEARRTKSDVEKTDDAIGRKGLAGAFDQLKSAVGAFAIGAGLAITVNFLKNCVTEAANAELQFVRLTASMKMAGNYSPELAEGLKAAAYQISQISMIDDEVAMGLLAVAMNLGLTAGEAKVLVERAIDANAALGKGPEGLETTVRALATSIASGSTRSLKQFGINIKEMKFEAGNATPILKELTKWTGAAAREMDTMAGKTNLLAKAWKEYKEELGRRLADTMLIKGALGLIGKAMEMDNRRLAESASKYKLVSDSMGVLGEQSIGFVEEINVTASALENSTKRTQTFADAVWDLLKAYNSVEARAARFVENLRNPPRLPTQRYQQVGMLPYAPPATMTEAVTPPGTGIFAEFPSSWSEETIAYAESLKIVGANMREIIDLGATYQENLDLQTAKSETLADVTNMITGAMAQFAGQLVYAALMGEQVTARMLKSMLASLAAEATVKAVFELAEGWADSATGNAPAAAAHFIAAKIYGMVAGVAAAASMAFGGGGRSTSASRYSRGKSNKEAETTAASTRNVNVTVYLEGHGIITDPAAFSREIIEQTKRQMSKSGQT